ncbi:MAG: hypothetical protein WBQ21_13260, partial [Solirubrobacteraceae bacterium]
FGGARRELRRDRRRNRLGLHTCAGNAGREPVDRRQALGASQADLDARLGVGDGASYTFGTYSTAETELPTGQYNGRRCTDGQDADNLPDAVIAIASELKAHCLQREVVMRAEGGVVESIIVCVVHDP